jgi:hypothetical protein
VHCTSCYWKEHAYQVWSQSNLKWLELCSGQALGDADADNDADTADKSNPYMSPFQGDTIKRSKHVSNFTKIIIRLSVAKSTWLNSILLSKISFTVEEWAKLEILNIKCLHAAKKKYCRNYAKHFLRIIGSELKCFFLLIVFIYKKCNFYLLERQ